MCRARLPCAGVPDLLLGRRLARYLLSDIASKEFRGWCLGVMARLPACAQPWWSYNCGVAKCHSPPTSPHFSMHSSPTTSTRYRPPSAAALQTLPTTPRSLPSCGPSHRRQSCPVCLSIFGAAGQGSAARFAVQQRNHLAAHAGVIGCSSDAGGLRGGALASGRERQQPVEASRRTVACLPRARVSHRHAEF